MAEPCCIESSPWESSWLFTESQNVQGWKGPLWVTQSNPLLKQGHPEQAAQHRIQVGLGDLQSRRLHSPSGQPGPGLRHPHSEEVLPHVQTELPLLQFVPVAPCPVAGHHWKESGPILLTPTLQIFRSISKVPSQPSLLQAEQAQLPQPFLIGEMLPLPCSSWSVTLNLPGLFFPQRGTMRRRYEDDGISDDEIEGKRTFDLEEKLSTNKFNSTFVVFMEGKGLSWGCCAAACAVGKQTAAVVGHVSSRAWRVG